MCGVLCLIPFSLIALNIVSVGAFVPNIHVSLDGLPATAFDWVTVAEPSDKLQYHSCHDDFECARVELPLDWQNATGPHKVALALIRLPAVVPEDDPRHGGTVILNPGGPGGSGILWALQIAKKMQAQLDGSKFYEILSFDPRGVFLSTPNAYCFESAIGSELWYAGKKAAGTLSASEYALKYNWMSEEARGNLCASTKNGRFSDGTNVRQYVSTASVARDMLELVKLVDKHHQAARKALDAASEAQGQQVLGQSSKDSSNSKDGNSKLQFIGTSYGTFLGQTFAAMYPQHVSRMVLDGNIDAENWVSRDESGVEDNEAARFYFFERCLDAKSECAFWREHDRRPEDILSRFEALHAQLEEIPAFTTAQGRAMPITAVDIRQGFFTTAYQPLLFFKPFARFLNDLLTKVDPGEPFWQRPVPNRDSFSDPTLANVYLGGEVSPSVHCADGPDFSDSYLPEFEAYLANLTVRFGWTGDLQANFKISCWSWPETLRTKWRFDGPFNASVPILFVNNRLDPVCPIRNARKMASLFSGSVTLEQDAVGHGALWPAGDCMWGHVRAYFESGVLPPPDTVCQPPCRPFGEPCDAAVMADVMWQH